MARPELNMPRAAHFSLGSLLALLCGIASLFLSYYHRWGWGLGLALAALLLGLAGLAHARSRKGSAGIIVVSSVGLALIALLVAAVVTVMQLPSR